MKKRGAWRWVVYQKDDWWTKDETQSQDNKGEIMKKIQKKGGPGSGPQKGGGKKPKKPQGITSVTPTSPPNFPPAPLPFNPGQVVSGNPIYPNNPLPLSPGVPIPPSPN